MKGKRIDGQRGTLVRRVLNLTRAAPKAEWACRNPARRMAGEARKSKLCAASPCIVREFGTLDPRRRLRFASGGVPLGDADVDGGTGSVMMQEPSLVTFQESETDDVAFLAARNVLEAFNVVDSNV